MQHLWTLAIAAVFAWPGEAPAALPTTPAQPEASVRADEPVQVARRKKRKKKRRKKKRRKKRGGTTAVAPAEPAPPPPEPPPEETGAGEAGAEVDAAAAGDSNESADWGSSDWASPDWASEGGGATTNSSSEARLEETGSDGAEAEPVEEVAQEVTPAEPYRKAKGVAGAFLLFSPVYSGVNRNFAYSPENGTSDNLRPYEASYVSMVGGRLEFYPGVLLGVSAIDVLGVRAGYRMALGLKSAARTQPDVEYGTSWNELDVDLAGRFVFGDAMVTAGAGFGMLNFNLDVPGSDPLSEQVHDLGYQYVRVGVDLRYNLGELGVLAGGAFRYVLGTGELGDSVFPDSSAIGFDANAGVAYQVLRFAELFASFQFTQFMHSLTANATYDADGATDRYLGGQAGVTLFF